MTRRADLPGAKAAPPRSPSGVSLGKKPREPRPSRAVEIISKRFSPDAVRVGADLLYP